MKTYVQKNIMISPELWKKAKIFSETLTGENISSLIRKALEGYIEKESKNNLAYKMRISITEYVNDEEQKEIEDVLSSLGTVEK